MRDEIVVIGLGNTYRRDDGVGVVVAAALDELALPGVQVVTGIADPTALLEAWSEAKLAMVIDAAVSPASAPGRVRRCTLDDVAAREGLSSHSVDVRGAHALGRALGRVPGALVLFTVDAADTGHGLGLTPRVAGAVPKVVGMAVAEINGLSAPASRSRRRASR